MGYMGAIYVEVDANAVNGVMTLAASGGIDQGGYYLHWDSNGFQGGNVLWSALEPYIAETGWPAFSKTLEGEYNESFESFMEYVNSGVDNLTPILGNWPGKGTFVENYISDLGFSSSGGCLEFVS